MSTSNATNPVFGFELRPYQRKACRAIATGFLKREKKSLLLVLPTGCGKTICFGSIAKWAVNDLERKVLVLAHRGELMSTVLRVAEQLATADKIGISDVLLRGLLHIHRNYDGGLDDRRLLDRLKNKGAEALVSQAKKSASYHGSAKGPALAEGMMLQINKNIQKKFVLRVDSTQE